MWNSGTLTQAVVLFMRRLYVHLSVLTGKSKEAEVKRINKELANIRSKFKGMFNGVCMFLCLAWGFNVHR